MTKKTTSESVDYLAYLLRFWREEEAVSWRATIEDPHTGEKRSFAAPEDVWDFLQNQLFDSPAQE